MSEIYQLPENGNNGNATIPFSIPIGFGGMGGGLFGGNYGMNGIADLFGLAIIASMFSGGCFGSSVPSTDSLKETHGEDENKKNVFSIPVK